jgi:FtsP/CotA-like multicopper oxidase with cupredoxin domain
MKVKKIDIHIISIPILFILSLITVDCYAQMETNGETKTKYPVPRTYAEKQVKPTGKRVEYDLFVTEKEVNFTGKRTTAIVINDGIPGPVLYFTEGDFAVIRVHNQLKNSTTMHWHGMLVPNRQYGVAFLNTPEIKAGETHTFEFPIV